MTEQEGAACDYVKWVLSLARRMSDHRKHRLFSCGCCRTLWDSLGREQRQAVEASEDYADGWLTKQALKAAVDALPPAGREDGERALIARAVHYACRPLPEGVAHVRGIEAVVVAVALAGAGSPIDVSLVRCVFGNPFRSPKLDRGWLTWHGGLLVSMARRMYDGRDFAAMPVLADALEEAGCTDPDMLSHCRSGGGHVRGCWLIDLLLDKA
jgi:hypothetical protein